MDETKLIELFVTEGKGATIEIVGEPIFPLKMTAEYLKTVSGEQKLEITKCLQTSKNNLLGVAINCSTKLNNPSVEILVEGVLKEGRPASFTILDSKPGSKENYKPEFKLEPDEQYDYKISGLKVYENLS